MFIASAPLQDSLTEMLKLFGDSIGCVRLVLICGVSPFGQQDDAANIASKVRQGIVCFNLSLATVKQHLKNIKNQPMFGRQTVPAYYSYPRRAVRSSSYIHFLNLTLGLGVCTYCTEIAQET